MIEHNIYIHIPICKHKCNYCAFYSLSLPNPDWDSITNNIIQKIYLWNNNYGSCDVPTIFFGGGTPSLMPTKYLDLILTALYKNFNVLKNAELTIECNPISNNSLQSILNLGFNRISIGVQSFNDDILKFLGRIHTKQDAFTCIDFLQNKKINFSCDFIYGYHFQTIQDIKNLCQTINCLQIPHCSLYELSIEKNTPFFINKVKTQNNDVLAQMYETIQECLKLKRYEVSNYSINKKFECKHNSNIWAGNSYIGFGKSACGRPFINNIWYEQKDNILKKLDNKTRNIEKIITGLRTKKGVLIDKNIIDIINLDFIENNKKLVYFNDNYLKVSKKGFMILDYITESVIK